MSAEPWSPEAFEARYRAQPDPWNFAHSDFEQRRYDAILQNLPENTYQHAYEPGCSVGELTVRLAPRCSHIEALDVSPTVVARARERCRGWPNVDITVGSVADDPPCGLDLIVFAELGYYFRVEELAVIAQRLERALEPGGDLLACHWLGTSVDHQLHGSVVHAELAQALAVGCRHVGHQARPEYVIDVWKRR